MSKTEVFAVDGDEEDEEEDEEVIKNDPVLFGRSRWWGLKEKDGVGGCGGQFNRCWRRSPRRSIRRSRSGSRSRRAPGCGTAFRGACAFGFGIGVWFFWRGSCRWVV